MPELVDDAAHAGARAVVLQPGHCRAQAEIGRAVEIPGGLDLKRCEALDDLRSPAGVGDELASLLDDGPRDRLGEPPRWQPHLQRLGPADLTGRVLGFERHGDPQAGPGMGCKLQERHRLAGLGG